VDRLTIGDTLPHLMLRLIDGSSISLPEAIRTRFLMLQFYRGTW
jgi:peroxiredoxin